jgi:prepilin-type processing-associated H-X9-DG protein
MIRQRLLFTALLASAATLFGQTPAPQAAAPSPQTAQQTAAFLAPYTDSQTLLVAHVDLDRIDSAALFHFIDTLLANVPHSEDARKSLPMAQTAFDLYFVRLKQIGIRHIYVVSDQTDLAMSAMGGVSLAGALLVPLPAGADPAAANALYTAMGLDKSTGIPQPTVLPGNVLAISSPEIIARLRRPSASPAESRTLTDAFSADEGAAVQVVGLLSRDAQRVLTEMPFHLPPSLGGQSSSDYTTGLEAATAALSLPPQPQVTVTLSATDPAAAARLATAFNNLMHSIPATPWFTDELQIPAPKTKDTLRTLLTRLSFTPSGSTASLRLQGDELTSTVASLLVPDFQMQREISLRVKAASQMKELMTACLAYASSHQGDYPPTLQTLVDDKLISDARLLTSPRDLTDKTFVYHPWTAEQLKKLSPSETPTIWEHANQPDTGVNVAFADGHIEFMRLEKYVEEELQDAEKKLKP